MAAKNRKNEAFRRMTEQLLAHQATAGTAQRRVKIALTSEPAFHAKSNISPENGRRWAAACSAS